MLAPESLSEGAVSNDPLQLVTVGDIYRRRVSFGTPIWASLVVLGVAWIATGVSCPPMHPVLKMAVAGAAVLTAVTLLGGVVLRSVISIAGVTLVNQLGPTAINVYLGNMIPAFGWAFSAMTLLSAIRLAVVVMTEYTLDKTQEKITCKAGETVLALPLVL
ncbi:hypothetical protein B9Z19DRAFT_1129008 [Tuber borchii]|uniref:Uncharacterized protein n=1 Tax=Tuber borchii TaxID=42251 RepID=A0A2T6ZN24_TUBBO|nr:hypothetical protein B9Z19DRAFT_1129008 [Tuber borchii]